MVYKPENLDGLQVGKRALLKVIGRVSDEKGDAVLIDFPRPDGAISHITISCAEGTPPGYSMRLTEKAVAEGTIEELKEPVFIEVIAGYEDGRNMVILKP